MSRVDIGTLPLKQVLIRFYTRPPRNSQIQERTRNDTAIEKRHREEAITRGVNPNRMMRGKPDSGQMVGDFYMATLDLLVADLRKLNFKLIDTFWNQTRRTDRPGMKAVITFVFGVEGEEITLSPIDQKWFERRCRLPHQKTAIWANPKRKARGQPFTWRCDTINARVLKPNQAGEKLLRMLTLGKYSYNNA